MFKNLQESSAKGPVPYLAGNKTSLFKPLLKCEVKNSEPQRKSFFQIWLLITPHFKFSFPEVVGYKISLFYFSPQIAA